MKISVICVTKRKGAIEILKEGLHRQTFKDFEVILADELYDERPQRDITWFHFKPRKPGGEDVWNINKAYNDCLDRARGELLVFLQDFIWIPDDGLQKFWDMYQKHPNALVTGVGNKAKDGLKGISEIDMRITAEEKPTYTHWELNWASCPRKIMPRFNELMDRWYGGENQYVAKLAMHLGAEIMVDKTNECIGYSQEHCGGRPHFWEEFHSNKMGRLAAFLEFLERQYGSLDKASEKLIVKTKDGGTALSTHRG